MIAVVSKDITPTNHSNVTDTNMQYNSEDTIQPPK